MSNNTKYLSYEGLSYFKNIIEGRYEKKGHVHRYLPLSGGALTGPLVFNGSDVDRNVIRINYMTGDANKIGEWGYTLKFLGSGSGVNNALALYVDNSQASTQNLATKWLNDGTMYGRSILPHANNTFDLGSSSLKWKNVYATTFTGNLTGDVTGNSTSSTKTGDGTNILYAEKQNEINFGGTSNSATIYFGYRAADSKPIPSKFVFGSTTGTSELLAKTYKRTDGTEVSYVGHTHSYLTNAGAQSSATTRNLTNFPTTKTLFTGYWGSETDTLGYNTRYGTTLDISYSTWYQRLAFNTSVSNGKQRIEYFSGINTNNTGGTEATLTKIGDLAYTSDIPTKVSQLTNDAGYTTASGHTHLYIPLSEKVNATAVSHTNYNTNGTYVPTMNFLSYWNGAYNSGNSSNLTYCKHGAFGTIVTKNAGDYATAGHTHSYVPTKTVTFTPAETAIGPAEVLSKLGSGYALGKGTWDYAGNGYISKDTTGSIAIDLAGCSVIQLGGSSAYTQLYITAPASTTTNSKTNEILFYNNHGSSYSPAWTRVLTNRNYSEYCATKTHTHDTLTPNEIDIMFRDDFGITF